jgi:integrase
VRACRRCTPDPEIWYKFRSEHFPLLSKGTRGAYGITPDALTSFPDARRADPEVQEVRQGHISDFLTWRRVHPGRGKEPVSNRTIQGDRTVLHTLFAHAEELELRDGNPVARVKAPKADPRDPVILTAEEYDRFLRVCEHNPVLYLYVLTMGETGARSRSEVLELQWPDVDLDGGFIRIRSGGSRQRTKGKGDGSR